MKVGVAIALSFDPVRLQPVFPALIAPLAQVVGDRPLFLVGADAAGSMIFQTLQEEMKARGARKVQIINLWLEPRKALEMGLEVEMIDAW